MIRPIVLAAVLALAASPALAQQKPPLIRLILEPISAPSPALKYTLLPQLRDRRPGNAVVMYYRSFSPELQTYRQDPKYMERVADSHDKPLRDLTRAEIDDLAGKSSSGMLKEVDLGARRTYCDWDLNERVREEGIGLLLPDVQGFRQVVSLLKLRARQELLAGQYDQAARTLQTGLNLGRDIATGPTLIHGLVGVACAMTMLTVVDDWINRPGAPNLYWALSDLPRPLISVRNGFEGERLFMDWLFPGHRELLDDPNSPAAMARVRTTLDKYAEVLELEGAGRTFGPLFSALKTYPRAKRFLRQLGRSAEEIEAMPALQVVFLYEIHQYDLAYDDMRKWVNLPYSDAVPHLRRVHERLKEARSKQEAGTTLASLLLPAINKVLLAPVRVERKIAALRCVEALRMYAATHGGKLPASLDAVTDVPIPIDPRTGKPFEYRLEGDKAILTGPVQADDPPNVNNTLRYELTIRIPRREKETGRRSIERLAISAGDSARIDKQEGAVQARRLAGLIEEETFALVRIDFARSEWDGFAKALPALLPARKDDLTKIAGRLKEFQTTFVKAGGSEMDISFSSEELPAISYVQVPLKDGSDVPTLTALLKRHLPAGAVVLKRDSVLIAGPREAIERLAKARPSARPVLSAALKAAGDSAIAIMLLPTTDQRRVIDEVITLPVPGASTKVLTRGLRWATLALDLGAKPRAELTIQSIDAATAKKLAALISAGVSLFGGMKFLGEDKILKDLLPKEFETAAATLKPDVVGDQVHVQVSEPDAVRALALLTHTISERKGGAERSTVGVSFRDIIIAMHKYHDANGTFPPHAIYSKAGRPLLSWRVALLPYLDEGKLYAEFKLEEPWDSPNNKKLIARMPKIYQSPKIRDARPGLTTYLAPIGKEFIFTGTKDGTPMKEIHDGTSNTAILVDVNDETGIIWTKPNDLFVDKKDPWNGLLGHYPAFVLVGMADASVMRVAKTAKSEALWALFTRAGGDKRPELSR